jgi:hypothetical protein
VVFDAHEYEPEQFRSLRWWRVLMQPYVKALAAELLPRVTAMTTVSAGLAERYARDFGIARPVVVTNAPHRADLEPRPPDGDHIRLVHWGLANPVRRLEDTIELMRLLDERFTLDLVLVGRDARYQRRLQALAAGDARIRFLDPVPMPDLPRFGNAYDIGVFLLPGAFAQQQFVLPNKFFEFVQARLAVAIGPSPEMARIADQWGFGVIADSFEPAALAAKLNALDAGEVLRLKRRAHAAADELSAEANRQLILDVVERAAS